MISPTTQRKGETSTSLGILTPHPPSTTVLSRVYCTASSEVTDTAQTTPLDYSDISLVHSSGPRPSASPRFRRSAQGDSREVIRGSSGGEKAKQRSVYFLASTPCHKDKHLLLLPHPNLIRPPHLSSLSRLLYPFTALLRLSHVAAARPILMRS